MIRELLSIPLVASAIVAGALLWLAYARRKERKGANEKAERYLMRRFGLDKDQTDNEKGE